MQGFSESGTFAFRLFESFATGQIDETKSFIGIPRGILVATVASIGIYIDGNDPMTSG